MHFFKAVTKWGSSTYGLLRVKYSDKKTLKGVNSNFTLCNKIWIIILKVLGYSDDAGSFGININFENLTSRYKFGRISQPKRDYSYSSLQVERWGLLNFDLEKKIKSHYRSRGTQQESCRIICGVYIAVWNAHLTFDSVK